MDLMQTLALVSAWIFAIVLFPLCYLTIKLMVLLVGITMHTDCQPFEALTSQRVQVTA